MSDVSHAREPSIRVGVANRPKVGESISGDRWTVLDSEADSLVVVVDGLGHGPIAAEAASAACGYAAEHRSLALPELMQGMHGHLSQTRGAAVALLRFQRADGRLGHCAVGNVEVVGLCREPLHPVAMPGIVGCQLRRVRETWFQLHPGDIVVAHSDGISRRFELQSYRHLDAQEIADSILLEWGKAHDDATCACLVY